MKILHTLVGYLAVTSLPFHPFAFASPLATDYDGYVNMHIDGAIMKHVLDSIVETCQRVTMQNHSDTTLIMKRIPGDSIIDAHQEIPGGLPSPEITVLALIIAGVVLALVSLGEDKSVRGNGVACSAI